MKMFQDSEFAGDLEYSKINIRWTLVHFRKSHARANKLDVQETNFSFTQFYRSWNNFSRCWFTHGWDSSSWSLGFIDWSISFLTKPHQQNQRCRRATEKPVGKHSTKHAKADSNHAQQSRSDQYWSRWDLVIEVFHSSLNQLKKPKDREQGNLLRDTSSNKHSQNQAKTPIQHHTLELCNVDYVSSIGKSSQFGAMLYILRTTKQWLKWSSKAEVQQWDMCPEPTELLLTDCLTELFLIQRFKN